jgi:hypothetical protein
MSALSAFNTQVSKGPVVATATKLLTQQET